MIRLSSPTSPHGTNPNSKRIACAPLRAAMPAIAGAFLCALLVGCAGPNTVRGHLNYDVRPSDRRDPVVLPAPPDIPRYRYVGELVGEQNFEHSEKSEVTLQTAFKWIVGLFETSETVQLRRPQHGAVSAAGRVYVVDAGRNAILVFDPHPPADEKPGSGKGEGQLLVWDMVDERTRLGAPVALALAWNGDIAVSDIWHGAVLRLSQSGKLVSTIGGGQLQRPAGVAFDAESGLLFVADAVANNVKAFDESGTLVRTIGEPGEHDGQFNAPTHLAFAEGRLYVSDTLNNRVQVFDARGNRLEGFGERGLYVGNFTRPKGIAVDSGITYVVEAYYGHLLAYNEKRQLLLGINGNGMKGDTFFLPSGVWSDGKGRLFIADMYNGRVVVFEFLGKKEQDVLQAVQPESRSLASSE